MTKYTEDQELIIAQYEKNLTFTDRESYLKWRDQWRQDYAEISGEIRTLRRTMVETMKAGSYAGQSQYNRLSKRQAAFKYMMQRTASKRKSAKLRAAAIAEKAAA